MSDVQIAAEKRARELVAMLPDSKPEDLLAIAFMDGAVHGFDIAVATTARVDAIHHAKRNGP